MLKIFSIFFLTLYNLTNAYSQMLIDDKILFFYRDNLPADWIIRRDTHFIFIEKEKLVPVMMADEMHTYSTKAKIGFRLLYRNRNEENPGTTGDILTEKLIIQNEPIEKTRYEC